MKNISLNIDKALGTVTKEQVYAQAAKAHECNATLQNGNGAGNDFLGWLHLPSSITDAELTDIENTARHPSAIGVAVNVGCWSHRRGHIVFDKDLNYKITTHTGVEL